MKEHVDADVFGTLCSITCGTSGIVRSHDGGDGGRADEAQHDEVLLRIGETCVRRCVISAATLGGVRRLFLATA